MKNCHLKKNVIQTYECDEIWARSPDGKALVVIEFRFIIEREWEIMNSMIV